MPKKGMNTYKRKDGRWEGRFIKGYAKSGKAKYGYVYAKSYTELKEKLAVQRIPKSSTTTSSVTLTDLSERWLYASKLRVKESTYAGYVNLLETHILPVLGGYRLSKLSSDVLNSFTVEKLASGRADNRGGLSAKTVRNILALINSLITYGESEKMIEKDSISLSYPKNAVKEMRVFSKQEQSAIENVLLHDTDLCKFGVMLCLYTGIRIGELCALKWESISPDCKTISIRHTVQRIENYEDTQHSKTRLLIDVPKSYCSARDIPLPEFITAGLKKMRVKNKDAYFLTGSSEKLLEPRTMQYKFKNYLRESGLDDVNFHTLRHTFATRCVEMGFDTKSLSEILGHADVNITLNRYVHSSFELKQRNMSRFIAPMEILSPSF